MPDPTGSAVSSAAVCSSYCCTQRKFSCMIALARPKAQYVVCNDANKDFERHTPMNSGTAIFSYRCLQLRRKPQGQQPRCRPVAAPAAVTFKRLRAITANIRGANKNKNEFVSLHVNVDHINCSKLFPLVLYLSRHRSLIHIRMLHLGIVLLRV